MVKSAELLTATIINIIINITIAIELKSQKQPPEVFCEERCSKNFASFTGKRLCWRLFLIKLQP